MTETPNPDQARYHAAAHAMQSGVAAKMNYEPGETNPKHLRVGVNSALSSVDALVKLLLAKGVFTEEEYVAANADAMEREVVLYERWLSDRLGTQVHLG